MKLLVADDETAICSIFSHHLSHYPSPYIDWKIVNDGKSLVRISDEWNPDMIITDINMPNMSGLEAIEEIRHSSAHPIRIYILSGYTDFELVRSALKLGVSDYIPKPIRYAQVETLLITEETQRFMGITLKDAYKIGNEQKALLASETIQYLVESFERRNLYDCERALDTWCNLQEEIGCAIDVDYFAMHFGVSECDPSQQIIILRNKCRNDKLVRDNVDLSVQMKHMVEEYFSDTSFGLDSVAASLGYNTQYLSMLFKKDMNENFSSYLTRCRINHAKLLLVDTDMKIKDIALACGYNYPNYFIKVFNRLEGTAPAEWRKLNHKSLMSDYE